MDYIAQSLYMVSGALFILSLYAFYKEYNKTALSVLLISVCVGGMAVFHKNVKFEFKLEYKPDKFKEILFKKECLKEDGKFSITKEKEGDKYIWHIICK